jgi:hypothetical protein
MAIPITVLHQPGRLVYSIILNEDGEAWVPSTGNFEELDGTNCDDGSRYAIDCDELSCMPGVYRGTASIEAEGSFQVIAWEQMGSAPDLTVDEWINGVTDDTADEEEISLVDLYELLQTVQGLISQVEAGGGLTRLQAQQLQELYQRRNQRR